MSLDYRHTPLPAKWPGEATPDYNRTRSPWKVTWARLLEDLERELYHLDAREIMIALDVDDKHLRFDGKLYADARPRGPAVILSFKARDGSKQSYPCDLHSDWQHNLKAIQMTLTALRAVDRYGVAKKGQQYRGFLGLPPAGGTSESAPPPMTVEDAAEHIAAFSPFEGSLIRAHASVAAEAVKIAKRRAHPDAGGAADDFKLVQEAAGVVAAHHGEVLW